MFFYQNSYGSRVFFDDLGPPWPKHGCTNRPANRDMIHRVSVSVPTVTSPKHRADWLIDGWQPFSTVRDPKRRSDRIYLQSFATGDVFKAALDSSFVSRLPVVFAKSEEDGFILSTLSDGTLEARTAKVKTLRKLTRASPVIGFLLHVDIEKRLWRELAIRAQIKAILAHRHPTRRQRR